MGTDPNKNKRIIAKSRGTYRGVVIIEVSTGYLIFIGAQMHGFSTFQETTDYIDKYCETRRN